ncbi:MAG TPA: isoprenylcysteine carboxylmethyltransferase family protein [Spirochaetia bacterium]|nr:isoprenylcysteine carboxylmethyltransferase family protein [Spirochaetia bacterium]
MPETKPRTLFGDAPRLLLIVSPAMIAAVGAFLLFPSPGSFTLRYRGIFVWAAIVLIALAVPFWVSAAFELVRAWRNRRLATRGAFGLSRHPIFAVWIWFVLPVTAFLADSWYFLAADLVFLVASIASARTEEAELRKEFGQQYDDYLLRVRSLVLIPRLRPLTGARLLKGLGIVAAIGIYTLAVTIVFVVPAVRTLGATATEAAMRLPGDELAPDPQILYTQAITIQAPPRQVWPWLVQVGYRRAGWYNIDSINRMADPGYFIDGDRSSTRVHPELQNLRVGDTVGLAPGLEFAVAAVDPDRSFTIAKGPNPGVSRTDPGYMNAVWTFALYPIGSSATRVIVRYRTELNGGFFRNFWVYFFNDIGGALLQQPAMLHGVQIRAQRM